MYFKLLVSFQEFQRLKLEYLYKVRAHSLQRASVGILIVIENQLTAG
jgi:hypothetical protein